MKKQLFLAALTLIGIAGNSQSGGKTPYLTKKLGNESIQRVESRTSGGSISVAGGNASESRVEVYISSSNGRNNLSKEEIQKKLTEDYDLTLSVSGGKLTASCKQKHHITNWRNELNVSFKIFVTQNTATDLSTSGGSISLNNLNGTQDFETSGGSLDLTRVSGKIHGRTSGGSIDVSECKEDLDLGTSGGSIDADHCTGKIRLNTSGGSLSLKDLKGNVRATTSGGNVDGRAIDGELFAETSGGNVSLKELSCSVEASTSGGDIDVAIRELRDYVKIYNSSGHIDLEIPANKGVDLRLTAEKIKTGTLQNFSGSVEDHAVHGKLNGGGVPITADAGSGRINLTFK